MNKSSFKIILTILVTLVNSFSAIANGLDECSPELVHVVTAENNGALAKAIKGGTDVNCLFSTDVEFHDFKDITPLMYTANRLQPEMVSKLISGGANVDYKSMVDGRMAIHYAAAYSNIDGDDRNDRIFLTTLKLMQHRAKPDVPDAQGATARTMNPVLIADVEKFMNGDLFGRTTKAFNKKDKAEKKAEKDRKKEMRRSKISF